MKTGVYVDVLIVTNFIINYLMLIVSGKLAGRSVVGTKGKKWRVMLAALLGGLFSLTIFLPEFSKIEEIFIKFISSAVMIFVANKFQGILEFLKEWLFLFVVTALFGGIMLAAFMCFLPNNMLCANGVVYFHMSPILLIINVSIAYFIVWLTDRLFQGSHMTSGIYPVMLKVLGKTINLTGLVDTGNSLREPFSGLAVIVCGEKELGEMLPKEIRASLIRGQLSDFPESIRPLVRMVPYKVVNGSGILPAIRGERLIIKLQKKEKIIVEDFYLAISLESVGHKDCPLLLSEDLIKAGKQKIKI